MSRWARALHLEEARLADEPVNVETFDEGVAWVLARQAAGRKVFVHCMEGAGRGPIVGTAVLVACGYRASDALHLIRLRRRQTAPNVPQLESLRQYCERHGPC